MTLINPWNSHRCYMHSSVQYHCTPQLLVAEGLGPGGGVDGPIA